MFMKTDYIFLRICVLDSGCQCILCITIQRVTAMLFLNLPHFVMHILWKKSQIKRLVYVQVITIIQK